MRIQLQPIMININIQLIMTTIMIIQLIIKILVRVMTMIMDWRKGGSISVRRLAVPSAD